MLDPKSHRPLGSKSKSEYIQWMLARRTNPKQFLDFDGCERLQNSWLTLKVMATPLAEVRVDHRVEVKGTKDHFNTAAGGGCADAACSGFCVSFEVLVHGNHLGISKCIPRHMKFGPWKIWVLIWLATPCQMDVGQISIGGIGNK